MKDRQKIERASSESQSMNLAETHVAGGIDADKKQIGEDFWFRTQEKEIAPCETITFRVLYENPPKGMQRVIVTFGQVLPK